MTDKTFKRKLHDEIVRAEERAKILGLLDKMKNPNDYSTDCICDQCGNNRTNATLAELRQQIKEMK
jgi:hypothetical protein